MITTIFACFFSLSTYHFNIAGSFHERLYKNSCVLHEYNLLFAGKCVFLVFRDIISLLWNIGYIMFSFVAFLHDLRQSWSCWWYIWNSNIKSTHSSQFVCKKKYLFYALSKWFILMCIDIYIYIEDTWIKLKEYKKNLKLTTINFVLSIFTVPMIITLPSFWNTFSPIRVLGRFFTALKLLWRALFSLRASTYKIEN